MMTPELFALAAIMSLPNGPVPVLIAAAGLLLIGVALVVSGLPHRDRNGR